MGKARVSRETLQPLPPMESKRLAMLLSLVVKWETLSRLRPNHLPQNMHLRCVPPQTLARRKPTQIRPLSHRRSNSA